MNKEITNYGRMSRVLSATWATFAYEVETHFAFLKTKELWLYLLSILAVVFIIIKIPILALICLLLIIIIRSKFDYDTGKVTHHIRVKRGIPTKAQIKMLKQSQAKLTGGQDYMSPPNSHHG